MIAAIEQAIIDRIKDAAGVTKPLGYALAAVESYGGEFDTELTLTNTINSFPGVWVVMSGLDRPTDLGDVLRQPITFTLFIATKNRRNEKARRHGAVGDVGSYQLLEDVRALLKGQTLGLDIDPLKPGRVRSIFNGQLNALAISLYAADFTTAWVEDVTEPVAEADLPEFLRAHADWDLPPLGNVSTPLPAAQADATDDIEVRTP